MKSLYENILSKSNVGKLALGVFNRNVHKAFGKAFDKLFDLNTLDDKLSDVVWFICRDNRVPKDKIDKQFLQAVHKFYDELKKLYKLDPFYQYEDGDGPVVDIRFAEAPKEWTEYPVITIGTIQTGGDVSMRLGNYDEGIYDMIVGE